MTTDTTTTTERPETPEAAAEREAHEAAEALAARAAEVAGMDDATLTAEATDAELEAEDRRLATLPRPSTRAILTVPRARGHERLRNAREALPGVVAAAIVTAARECARPEGPSLDSLRRAADLHALTATGEKFWAAIGDAIDGPAPAGMSECFSDDDPAAEVRAAQRAIEARRGIISDELAAREVIATVAARPGMGARLAALGGRGKGDKP